MPTGRGKLNVAARMVVNGVATTCSRHRAVTGMDPLSVTALMMVGKLARWLRVLGFDVAYSNTFSDDEIVRLAEAESRIILTRDTSFASRRNLPQTLLVDSDHYKEQVRQVLRRFNLKEFKIFSRCVECNTPLQEVDKEAVFERIPPYVYLTQERFAACPSCKRVYWRGTHTEKMLQRIVSVLNLEPAH